jgi:hypothetical protein
MITCCIYVQRITTTTASTTTITAHTHHHTHAHTHTHHHTHTHTTHHHTHTHTHTHHHTHHTTTHTHHTHRSTWWSVMKSRSGSKNSRASSGFSWNGWLRGGLRRAAVTMGLASSSKLVCVWGVS